MILSKQVLSLVNWCFNSQKLIPVRQIRWDFSPTRNKTRIHVGLAQCYVKAFTFLIENISVQFDGMVYQQIVGILWALTVLHL